MRSMPMPIGFRFGKENILPVNMELIAIAYVCSFLLLLPFLIKGSPQWVYRILMSMNVWLPLYSWYIGKIWWQLIRLAMQFKNIYDDAIIPWYKWIDSFFLQQIIILIVPFLFWFKRFRGNLLLSLLMAVVIYWQHPISNWYVYGWEQGLCIWLSLLCISFSVQWLTNQFSSQVQSGNHV